MQFYSCCFQNGFNEQSYDQLRLLIRNIWTFSCSYLLHLNVQWTSRKFVTHGNHRLQSKHLKHGTDRQDKANHHTAHFVAVSSVRSNLLLAKISIRSSSRYYGNLGHHVLLCNMTSSSPKPLKASCEALKFPQSC